MLKLRSVYLNNELKEVVLRQTAELGNSYPFPLLSPFHITYLIHAVLNIEHQVRKCSKNVLTVTWFMSCGQ